MAEKVSRDRGYRSDSIAISRDMGPLRREVVPEMGNKPLKGYKAGFAPL